MLGSSTLHVETNCTHQCYSLEIALSIRPPTTHVLQWKITDLIGLHQQLVILWDGHQEHYWRHILKAVDPLPSLWPLTPNINHPIQESYQYYLTISCVHVVVASHFPAVGKAASRPWEMTYNWLVTISPSLLTTYWPRTGLVTGN